MLLFCSNSFGQLLYLDIKTKNSSDNKVIDSLGISKAHSNTKLIFTEIDILTNKLNKIGYINLSAIQQSKPNDSTFQFEIDLKNQIKFINIYIGTNSETQIAGIDDLNAFTKRIKFDESTTFLNQLSMKLEAKGYSQAKVQLVNITQIENHLTADLKIELGTKRIINEVVIVGYDKFPIGIKKNILREFKNKSFTTANLKILKNKFDNFNFVSQTKYPEILFLSDTTKVYIYLQKAKANRFDGLVGFGNDENTKLRFNGYLDLLLVNTINAGERFNLNWKSDGNRQTNFNVGIEIPYVFKSRFIVKSQLQIFKQDSLFQNTKIIADLGYLLRFNTRIFAGIQSTESTNIQNTSSNINSFDTEFGTIQFEYNKMRDRENPYYFLFPEHSRISLKAGLGKRQSLGNIDSQKFINVETLHNINISKKISVNVRASGAILKSNSYFINELYRFGGINSIRGFNENSLQANAFLIGMAELRYAISPSLYVNTVTDYGFFQDETTNQNGQLTGFGAGFGLLTKNGVLQFIYANGQQNSQGNSIVHLNYKIGF